MNAIQAHEILRAKLDHESRLVWQRIPALIITNSVLLVGEIMSLSYEYLGVIHVGLPLIGIIMSLAFAAILWEGARQQNKAYRGLYLIEQEPEFKYMLERKITTSYDMIGEKRELTFRLGSYFAVFPAITTAALWILVLVSI